MSADENWWAARGDRRIGPLTTDELQSLIASRALTGDTIVWTPSFGDDWKPLSQTPFSRLLIEPPPLPSGTDGDACKQRSSEITSTDGHGSPLPTVGSDDRYAWAMVAVPAAGLICSYILAVSGVALGGHQVMIACSISYPFLVLFDDYQQHKTRNDDRLLPIQFWWILIPVYLFLRARALAQPQTLLWSWLLSVLASLILTFSLGLA